VATHHYVFHKTSKSIEDYINDASMIMSLSSNQVLAFAENQLLPAPSSHSKHPTSDAGDLLIMEAEADLHQVLREQLFPLIAPPTFSGMGLSNNKCSFNQAQLPKPD
jgi:hypothetical protein